jgi:BMFP domain-containing protein YqiC
MTGPQGRLYDEFARLMTDAASVAQSAGREVSGAFRAQAERFASELDLARREELDIVRDIAAKALADVERLSLRVAELEARVARDEAKESADSPE